MKHFHLIQIDQIALDPQHHSYPCAYRFSEIFKSCYPYTDFAEREREYSDSPE